MSLVAQLGIIAGAGACNVLMGTVSGAVLVDYLKRYMLCRHGFEPKSAFVSSVRTSEWLRGGGNVTAKYI